MGIRARLSLLLIICLAPVFLAVFLIGQKREAAAVAEAVRDARRLAVHVTDFYEAETHIARGLLSIVAEDKRLRISDPATCSKILRQLADRLEIAPSHGAAYRLARFAPDGQMLCAGASDFPAAVSSKDFFQNARESHAFVFSGIEPSTSGNGLALFMAEPVLNEAQVLESILVLEIRANWLHDALSMESDYVPGVALLVLDKNGAVRFRAPDAQEFVNIVVSDHPLLRAVMAQTGGEFRALGLDGRMRVGAFLAVPLTGERVVASFPLNEILQDARQENYLTLAGLAFVLVAGGGLAWRMGHSLVVQPLRAMQDAVERIRSGDLQARIALEDDASEIGQLAQSFDALAEVAERRMSEQSATWMREKNERRRTEKSLTILAQALEQSPNLIFATAVDGTIEYANKSFYETTGYTPDEVIGANPRILKSGETPPEVYAEMWATLLAGRSWVGELKDRKKDGSTFWVSAVMGALRDDDGTISHFVARHEDITGRKLAEEQTRLARELAEISNRAKTELLANMSHELRTPLNAIIGYSDLILHELMGPVGHPKYREYLSDIHASGTHLLEVINDILDVSAIEAGKAVLLETSLDIAAVTASACRLVHPRALAGEVTLETEIAQFLPRIRADERRIKQILLNLLSNAVKFTPPSGYVRVRLGLKPNGGMLLTVEDTGEGMDAAGLAKAMEKFGQVDSGLSRKHEGTGLGLPLTKGLVEMHQGQMEIVSEKGRGTRVLVHLPPERIEKSAPAAE